MAEKTQIVITAKDETGAAINSARRGLASLQQAGSGLASTFASLGVSGGLIGLLGGAGLVSSLKETVNELDKLNQSAERLGVTASKFETLDFAGKLAGLEDGDMEKALAKLSIKLEEAAAGSKSAIAWFDKLKISYRDGAGNVKDVGTAFDDVSNKISEMADGTGKLAILSEGFGDKLGRKLAPALNGSAKGLESVRKELGQLGGQGKNLDELAKQADDLNDTIDKLSFYSKAAGRSLASDLIPSLNDTASAMLDAAKEGNVLYGILRGIAGIGKLPFDLLLGSSKPDLSAATAIKEKAAEIAGLENDLKDGENSGLLGRLIFGKKDEVEKKLAVAKTQLALLQKFGDKVDFKPTATETPNKPRGGLPDQSDKPKKAKAEADEALRLIQSLDEQIALKKADAESTDKMTAAEAQAVKVRYQLEAGTLKATAAQRDTIFARLDSLVVLENELAKQKEFTDALARQEESNVKSNQAMLEQIAAAEILAETYGLSAAAISSMTQSRLEDAIAITSQNEAMAEQTAALEEELARRQKLTAALEKSDLARLLSQTDSAKKAKVDADKALLDRALAAGKITPEAHKEAMAQFKDDMDQMSEFATQAARNMQDAFAEFLFDPFGKGTDDMLKNFLTTVQKMIAQALSAQLLSLLVGDMGKTGKVGDDSLVGAGLSALKSFDWKSIFSFANGGIMTSAGAVPLHKYAMGGIANRPQLAMFGEGRTPEAYVPLPDGRRIPVHMQGGGGGSLHQTLNFYGQADPAQVKRAVASGGRSVLALQNGARRYG